MKRKHTIFLGHQLADNLLLKEVLHHLEDTLKGKLCCDITLKFDLIVLARNGLHLDYPLFDINAGLYS